MSPEVMPKSIPVCQIDEHEWANEEHGDGHFEARCIVCLEWLNDAIAHQSAARPEQAE